MRQVKKVIPDPMNTSSRPKRNVKKRELSPDFIETEAAFAPKRNRKTRAKNNELEDHKQSPFKNKVSKLIYILA